MASTPQATDATFEIPELPQGEELRLIMLSNWGDPQYIGIKSIEIFMETGEKATISSVDCNSPAVFGDLSSLVKTDDSFDANRWFCARGEEPTELLLKLERRVTIAMIRIWNYNESRVHAQRGVRELLLSLDGRAVFKGEMNPAFDFETEYEPMGDTILFTTDERILELIAKHDTCLVSDIQTLTTSSLDVASVGTEDANREDNGKIESCNLASESLSTPFRPSTMEKHVPAPHKDFDAPRPSSAREEKDEKGVARVIHLELNSNWGLNSQIGLTGIEFIGKNGLPLNVKDHVTISAINTNTNNLEKLLNGRNLTRNPDDMCLMEYDPQKPISITIQFDQPFQIAGISFWNYNASVEMSYAGVRLMQIYINGRIFVGNVILRKAPGFVFFDFVQDIAVESMPSIRTLPIRPTTHSIGGFIFQLRLLSTWGDEFYIGLNGIELYNRRGERMTVKPHNLAAFPESVNILPLVEDDPRGSENLIDGVNDTAKASHMWLTPLLPNRCARIFFVFDIPTYVSKFVIYNYRKTPTRGVRHLSLSVDDFIVYSGEVPMSSAEKTGILEISMRETENECE